MTAVIFEASRTGYSVQQVKDRAMTVGELRELLEGFDDDDLFILSHDNGYTYGSINSFEMHEEDIDSEDDD